MRWLLSFLLFASAFLVGLAVLRLGQYREVYRSICELTAEKFYKDNDRLTDWVQLCRKHAAFIPLGVSRAALLERIQDTMNELHVSHFSIYSPEEDQELWHGQSVDTGIRSHYVEDHLIVYEVLPRSSAKKAGVKVGDEIVKLPGVEQVSPWGAKNRAGEFVLRRQGQEMHVNLRPGPLQVDFSPQLTALGSGVGLLRISSFRSEYFTSAAWKKMASRLSDYNHLVIDLRQNSGGNFVAMLRALSTFECDLKTVGLLQQPRKAGPTLEGFSDSTDDRRQLAQLEKYRQVNLRTFTGYGCYINPVTVLVDSDTSSVAEIFADHFKYRPRSRVWGQPTAGSVVLAVWYDLPALGQGFSFSIPEAVYINSKGRELEGEGVFPQKDLFYGLKESLQGEDSWIKEVLKKPKP